MAQDAGINVGGKKIPYKTLAIGALAAGALFIITRSGGNGGGGQVPVFPLGQTGEGGDSSWDSIQKQLSDLNSYYNDLLSQTNTIPNTVIDTQPVLYQIQAGDTPLSIAQKFGVQRSDLRHFNSWFNWKKWRDMKDKWIGQWLYVPHTPATA